ncbi:DUF4230 domain-containing protein [Tenacibaculum sp. SG-28]|uniref:DUF4230 domain-containing protein n=1 Tax=Tenacibaculum sp. SG-28 TaxID=754426 RepID=UPI000CF41B40|nr:DUF4230 domain-containing protein [Tenacibaculum sp. SG-28]PQJ21582.1 hypothetical protein BSU00_05585 [Tenacibaculum sp. SG-28]
MKRFLKYVAIFVFGFLLAKYWNVEREATHEKEEVEVFLNGVKNLSKLVVSQGTFSEMYSFSDTKKYLYDYISFEKKAILAVTAKVEVGYDLSKLDIQVDSLAKQIRIESIPEEEIQITPDITYFDLQQSSFNSFSKEELNTLNAKAVAKIENTTMVAKLKEDAKNRLFEELSKLYQLSKIYRWEVVNATGAKIDIPEVLTTH